ncbi:MAG: DoxX family protein [Planctomycetes bacterium]|nr:DoxX family protein [Planctomycetota bacterium]
MKWLEKYADHAYGLLRIVAGFMFCFHGAQKIFGLFGFSRPTDNQIWVGGFIELLGGLAVGLGFRTRAAAFLCSGTMAVAYFQFHWKFQIGRGFFPAINQGELAALYCFVFLFLACRGGVKWAMDRSR